MKVWITKYALTDGIIEAQQIPGSAYDGKEYAFFVGKNSQYITDFYIPYEELFWDKNSAIVKAEEMRQKKIASLKKQIEKLEEMRFE
ncbi:hypothetical protein [Bacteroides clarus]|uniref:hypothetical protein n=1 Tax=Bacteroides clarus TaxID=626929 RepID=UPI00248F3B0A|nr:hypothetical protein [Bacteroides clarus]